jgi:predicted transcriptional regulator of viral defense system
VADRIDLRRRLQAVAFRQAGYFTASQAIEAGYSHQAQKYHSDRGNWTRIDRGLYRMAEWPSSVDDAFARWAVWSGNGILSHHSAALVHDIGDLDPRHVHLSVSTPRKSPEQVVIHVSDLNDDDISERGAFRVTNPTRTVLDLAGSDVGQEQLDQIVGEAVDRRLVREAVIRLRMDDFGDRGALRLERALATLKVRNAV